MITYIGAIASVMILAHITSAFAIRLKRNDLADVIWGPGFVVALAGAAFARAFTNVFANGNWTTPKLDFGPREYVILTAVTVWGLRLFFHIGLRNLRKTSEDPRYESMRRSWGASWVWKTYAYVFILQAFLLLVIALAPLRSIEIAPRPFDMLVLIGIGVWLCGFIFEAIGDRQLKAFTAKPENKGRIMDQGLWSWSRHPNYFGEVVQWWGIFLMCVDLSSWWVVISPITITYLILKVSGVPMLEKLMSSRPGFREYQERTSVFWPRPPRIGNDN